MTQKLKLEDLKDLYICDCGNIFYETTLGTDSICSSCAYRSIDEDDN